MQCLLPAQTTLLIPMQDKWVGEIQKSRTLQFILHVVRTQPEVCRIRGAWGDGPPQILIDQLTLFKPRGADYAHPFDTCPHPTGFSALHTALQPSNWHTFIQSVLSYKKTDKKTDNMQNQIVTGVSKKHKVSAKYDLGPILNQNNEKFYKCYSFCSNVRNKKAGHIVECGSVSSTFF